MVRSEVFLPLGTRSAKDYGVYWVIEDKQLPETQKALQRWAELIGVDLEVMPKLIALPFKHPDPDLQAMFREHLHALAEAYQNLLPAKSLWIRRQLRASEPRSTEELTLPPADPRMMGAPAQDVMTFDQPGDEPEVGEAQEKGEGTATPVPFRVRREG